MTSTAHFGGLSVLPEAVWGSKTYVSQHSSACRFEVEDAQTVRLWQSTWKNSQTSSPLHEIGSRQSHFPIKSSITKSYVLHIKWRMLSWPESINTKGGRLGLSYGRPRLTVSSSFLLGSSFSFAMAAREALLGGILEFHEATTWTRASWQARYVPSGGLTI
jgi:hypothetical protein